jgi:hypothetical protein
VWQSLLPNRAVSVERLSHPEAHPHRIAAPAAEGSAMTRERLAHRRKHELFEIESMNMRFTASASRYPDGRIGELFMDNHKQGSAIGTLVRDMAIAFSFAVQHGADPEAIRLALCRNSQGEALGPLGVALDLLAARSKT